MNTLEITTDLQHMMNEYTHGLLRMLNRLHSKGTPLDGRVKFETGMVFYCRDTEKKNIVQVDWEKCFDPHVYNECNELR